MAKKLTQNVNKDKLFNDLPRVNPDKSKWLTRWCNYQACKIGEIIPIYYDEVLPNEKRKVTMSMISHTTTPVAPIFNSMYTEIRSFVVPIRLCADLLNGYSSRKSPWVKVFGEDNATTNSKIIVPLKDQELPTFTSSHKFIDAAYDFIAGADSIDNIFNALDFETDEKDDLYEYNYLNLAAYELIYQRHYRNENYEGATSSNLYRMLFDAYNVSKVKVNLGSDFTFEIANREKDYFTGMKPFTLKANEPVKVGLVGTAPVVTGDVNASLLASTQEDSVPVLKSGVKNVKFGFESGSGHGDGEYSFLGVYGESEGSVLTNRAGALSFGEDGAGGLMDGTNQAMAPINLYADLSSANGISIEELRLLIKTQELLEKDAMYGSLYAESLNAHFGCCPLDLTLQDPQEIYRTTITSNMQAIFQTSSTTGEASILGTIGANSTTQTEPFVILPETEFKEHCILMICAVHKLQNVYDSVWFKPKFITKKSRFDFYTPELNDLGYQDVTSKEMRAGSGVVGYNEAFAEYRYKYNRVHGSLANEFPYWAPSISSEYDSVAALYKEDPAILDKALSIDSTVAPQFYDAWGFEEENTKPMSLHSIPGFDGVI